MTRIDLFAAALAISVGVAISYVLFYGVVNELALAGDMRLIELLR